MTPLCQQRLAAAGFNAAQIRQIEDATVWTEQKMWYWLIRGTGGVINLLDQFSREAMPACPPSPELKKELAQTFEKLRGIVDGVQ